jgi:3'-phosphoadenosine 5'-phosphosulfate sulfotransferase (PAPS reductase)/FAD synthetase
MQPEMIELFETPTTNIICSDSATSAENFSYVEKVKAAKTSIRTLFLKGNHLVFSYSSGKDSSVMLNLGLNVASELSHEGVTVPRFVIMHGNTLLENPIINRFALAEISKIRAFISQNKLDASVEIATPSMSSNHMVNLIGGRTIASLPDTDSKCSVDMKINPMNRLKRKVFKGFGKEAVIVSCIGTRFEESHERMKAMVKRGESNLVPVEINDSLILSPIALFSLDDVWQYIANVINGREPSYSDFTELMDVYRDGEGGACAVIAYMDNKARTAGCGARFGCSVCNRVADDKSMENMLTLDKYAFMRPLNDLREWIRNTHYNPKNRNWLARSIDADGGVKISPNAYSPQHCEEMLKIVLTIQVREDQEAWGLGIAPRFQLLREVDILAIDVLWNRYGYNGALRACEIYRDIYEEDERYEIPLLEEDDIHTSLPKFKPVTVPFADDNYDGVWNGLRDLEMMVIDQEPVTVKANGAVYNDIQTSDVMVVDEEGCAMFFGFPELGVDHALEKLADKNYISPAAGFWYLVRLGVFSISKGQHSEFDRMLKMGNQIWRHGLRDHLNNPVELCKRLGGAFSFKTPTLSTQQNLFN